MSDSPTQRGRASQADLDELHGRLARSYLKQLDAYENGEVLNQRGDPKPPPASLLATCAKLLKDNGVDRPERDVDQRDTLNDELPDLSHFDEEEAG